MLAPFTRRVPGLGSISSDAGTPPDSNLRGLRAKLEGYLVASP